ncbi:MAG: signal recognition particle protein [Candidatus Sumerlaeota bacterium]|nr:signal recognition particle protein [Candidatus Sumerlaeota bacterium]
MFDSLGDRLDSIFKKLRGTGKISEENIKDAVRQTRLALLEADVNFKVVKDFTQHVTEKALGAEVLARVSPSEMFIKIVHDELVEMLGGEPATFALPPDKINTIVLLGLQGSGKTTFAGKLAFRFLKENLKPLLVACDIYRPAAVEQLQVVGQAVNAPVFEMGTEHPVTQIAAAAMDKAVAEGHNVVIFDTAGRLHIDEIKMDELQDLKNLVHPDFTFLVADATTGQDAVNSTEAFATQVGIDGVCLTKMDGDARGGAALSIKKVAAKPIVFIGVGEKAENLEFFYPDRMAGRILGMGDVVSLVEKAAEVVDAKQAEEMQKKIRSETFSFQDFLNHIKMVKRMGSFRDLIGMIPGLGKLMKDNEEAFDEKQFARFEAMIHSMTPQEREHPDILNGSRRLRIANGSHNEVSDVNTMIREFEEARKMMKMMMAGGGRGLKSMFGMGGGGGGEDAAAAARAGGGGRNPAGKQGSNYTPPKKKKHKPRHGKHK